MGSEKWEVKAVGFSSHAMTKLKILCEHGISLDPEFIRKVVNAPDKISSGYGGRKIAQAELDKEHVVRVVYEEQGDEILVVTFYPTRKGRYEKNKI